jgi:polyphosphate:AMP phosphotransferase
MAQKSRGEKVKAGKGGRARARKRPARARAEDQSLDYDSAIAELRDQLLDAQFELKKSRAFALVLIVTGLPGAGRSESVNRLIEWLDPKLISVHALGAPNADERHRPVMWRYWQALPERGRALIHFSGWYDHYLREELADPGMAKARERRRFERIVAHERILRADRVRVVKMHLHIAKSLQRKRLAALAGDPLTAWRVTAEDRWAAEHYGRVERVMERCLSATSHSAAEWHVIDGSDPCARELEVGRILLEDMRAGLEEAQRSGPQGRPLVSPRPTARLPSHQKGADLERDEYEEELAKQQRRLALLTRSKPFRKRSLVLAFEGMDAAGKGGAIRRLIHALDARQYRVVPISAPTEEELSYPYLWRFWQHVPARGRIAIFDRSWYGRVLVERVRGLTPEPDWRRAYGEIREFELQLAERKVVISKFWLQIGLDEQRQRFEARDGNPLKRFKVDPEDWENRRFYDGYQLAAREMIAKTDMPYAPWTVVEADDKRHARVKVLQTVCDALEAAL